MAVTTSGKDKVTRYARAYWAGYDVSGDTRTFGNLGDPFETADMTGWSNGVQNFLSNGFSPQTARGYQAILNDTAASGAHTLFSGANKADILIVALGGGGAPAVGDPSFMLPARSVSDPATFDSGTGVISVDFVYDTAQYSDNFATPWGQVLAEATAISSTTTYSSTDSYTAAATTSGYSAAIHILTTASGNFAIKVQHSTDDSAWADLFTFTTTGGAIGTELASGTGTVNQYLRAVATRTAGTITPVIVFNRNI